jgi:hypothetical protein
VPGLNAPVPVSSSLQLRGVHLFLTHVCYLFAVTYASVAVLLYPLARHMQLLQTRAIWNSPPLAGQWPPGAISPASFG